MFKQTTLCAKEFLHGFTIFFGTSQSCRLYEASEIDLLNPESRWFQNGSQPSWCKLLHFRMFTWVYGRHIYGYYGLQTNF